jgi:hypothetical protein
LLRDLSGYLLGVPDGFNREMVVAANRHNFARIDEVDELWKKERKLTHWETYDAACVEVCSNESRYAFSGEPGRTSAATSEGWSSKHCLENLKLVVILHEKRFRD